MAGIFPTQIEQINDFSSKAGAQVLDVLNKAPKTNYFDILSKVVDQATKATESQRLTEAVDAYNRAMEAGKSASEALVGLDPRVTGSKAFKDEADKIRSSILDQRANDRQEAMWANTLRQQARQEEANWLRADLAKTMATTPGSEALWLDDNKKRLEANPIAYTGVMQDLKGKDLYLPDADTVATADRLLASIPDSINKLEDAYKRAGVSVDNASNLGIALSTDLEKSPYLKDLNAFIEHQGKLRGYDGNDMGDFASNMKDAYKALSAKYGNLPQEQILAAMERYLDVSKWSYVPFLGRFAQDVIGNGAGGELEKLAPNFSTQKEMAERALTMKNLLGEAVKNDALQKELLSARTLMARYDQQYQDGIIPTKERAEKLKAVVAKGLISKLTNLGWGKDKLELFTDALGQQSALAK